MNLEFTDEELENYFRLQQQAENYINMLIRIKRIKQIDDKNAQNNINTQK